MRAWGIGTSSMTAHEFETALVAVDIGNSRIKLGRFNLVRGSAIERFGFDRENKQELPEPIHCLELPLQNRSGDFDAAALSAWHGANLPASAVWMVASVHCGAAKRFASAVSAWKDAHGQVPSLRQLTYHDLPITTQLKAPERIGIDRLLGAVAANHLRRPDRAAIVADLGTAISVDLITASGEFAGGAIMLGLSMSAQALEHHTDALPRVTIENLKQAPPVPGTDTEAAIKAGLFWGATGSIRELIRQLAHTQSSLPEVFITGGNSQLVAQSLQVDANFAPRLIPHLVLSGIALVRAAQAARNE
jgi:type III pantothenate kinase